MRGASPAPFHPGPPRWLGRLDLSEAQHEQILKIFHEQAPVIRERMKAARQARESIEAIASAPNFDVKQARAQADTEAAAIADMEVMRAESMSRIRQMLTPEQIAKLDQMRERRSHREPK
jgi:Spy/CpxP family protein refolding chaperone